MRTPTDLERERLIHAYDPAKAHEYYLRTRELTGRKPGRGDAPPAPQRTRQQVTEDARAKQRKALAEAVKNLERKLQKLEALIRKKEQEEKASNRKSEAKKERAAKEKDKPKTAAEKAKIARENAKYRDKHKQELKNKAKKDGKSGGGSSKGSADISKKSVSELKSLATRVKGQIAVAKQKLAAL